ncbi:MAG: HD domain-containing protein, partial [Sedimentisphaerales bacterium]|nr:HD domain-containing protein [Sedimentisphaerales bacterium]
LGEEDVQNIYLAGLLHDVGKIGVSEAVLRKPGKLIEGEFRQICRHPRIGAHILGSIKQMQAVTPAVLSHHEHFDGSGYPQGLLGADIPLGGRIVMLADSFDAMTSDRTYRQALPQVMALAEIRRFSGTQFDPQLAEVFLHGDIDRLMRQLDVVKQNQSERGYLYADLPN